MVENQTQEIVGQKRRAHAVTSSSASKEMVAAGGTRRRKRVKVAPTRYVPAEEESWTTSPHASSGVVTRNTTLPASPPLDNISASDETTVMNGINEDVNIDISSTQRSLAVAAATRVKQRKKGIMSFDERFKDLMAFKEEFGHSNVPQTRSRNDKHLSLGKWCSNMRQSYKAIKEGRNPGHKISKPDIRRLENAGFEWDLRRKTYTFDERFKDLMSFKAEFGHCNVPATQSNTNKHSSLGNWCSNIRRSYKAIKEGRSPGIKLSKPGIRRLENAGFEWCFGRKT